MKNLLTLLATLSLLCASFILTIAQVADAGPDVILNCASPQETLGGPLTSQGPDFTFEWQDESQVVISTDRRIAVKNPGFYFLKVTELATGSEDRDTVLVTGDFEIPQLGVSVSGILDCGVEFVNIISETNIPEEDRVNQWEGPAGGILTDPMGSGISVTIPGVYTLTLTNIENGCTTTSSAAVFDNSFSILNIALPSPIRSCVDPVLINPCSILTDAIITDANGVIFYGLDIPCQGFWEEQDGLTTDTFPNAIIDKSGQYTFVFTDTPGGDCPRYIFDVMVNIATQEEADEFMVDIGPNITYPDCFTGSITLTSAVFPVSNDYEYVWTTNDGSIIVGTDEQEIIIDEPGTYQLSVSNKNTGCSTFDEIVVSPAPDMIFTDVITQNVSCFSGEDGSVQIEVSGGAPPYIFEFPLDFDGENLAAGNYKITITESNSGCSEIASFDIFEPPLLNIEIVVNDDNQVEAIVTGGTGDYTYDWNVDEDSPIVDSPVNGFLYELTVIDENGCVSEENFLFQTNAVFSPVAKQISVFPNPTDGEIFLNFDTQLIQEIDHLQIYNIQGVAMKFSQRLIPNEGVAINLHHLQAGAYILHASIDGDLYYQKVIVQ